ncbi:hypothetical protein DL89DRAFT_260849 [Linderina pennispora]|uniref:Uncharacterized protein n=1 Tax=Linderina pennispora TaxID=61395 RepID=A0A1Y1VWK6_9FUNG|nr:uncharacterized protein DL89DRAFT_260849 [Linderina pennispora]ORX65679.1 hypothetical protein DL89DRAFT_260849 [Linderina pennispora]
MSSHGRIDGPDEDEHYEVPGHPSKAQKRTPQTAEPPEATSSNFRTRARAGSKSAGVLSTGRASLSSSHIMLVGNSTPNMNSSISLHEQVSRAKEQAKEILAALNAEKLLEQDLSVYLDDVESSLRAAWTREEDRLLTLGVRVYGPNTESWPRIAMLVPGRTNKSCRKRWFHSLDPSLHKGPWTPEEDNLLRERVSQFPAQWSRVAEGIPGRTDDQCAKRWRESLDPEIDRGKWRPEEDRLLLEKFAEFGTQWQKIATFFQGRPGLALSQPLAQNPAHHLAEGAQDWALFPENDLNRTLAAVTESVNKRKTAQRSRGSNHPSRSTGSPAVSSSSAATATAAQLEASQDASMEDLPGIGPESQQQQQQQLGIQTGISTSVTAGSLQSPQTGTAESIGALYMPSEQQPPQSAGTPATTPHFEVLRASSNENGGRKWPPHMVLLFRCMRDNIVSARKKKQKTWKRAADGE